MNCRRSSPALTSATSWWNRSKAHWPGPDEWERRKQANRMVWESENAPGSGWVTPASLESFIPNLTLEELLRAAANPALTEDLALSLLHRSDLPLEAIERLAKNNNVLKSRKVKFSLASNPHTPRRVSVPLIRQFYTFDVMKLSLTAGVPADVKVAAEDSL